MLQLEMNKNSELIIHYDNYWFYNCYLCKRGAIVLCEKCGQPICNQHSEFNQENLRRCSICLEIEFLSSIKNKRNANIFCLSGVFALIIYVFIIFALLF